MDTISVAMAVYNGEKFIRKQIDSILLQMKPEDELVISYDESKDNTLDIITEYANTYSQVKVYHNPGSGLFANFENAISRCNNDFIFISDQDDIWTVDKREKILADFKEQKCMMVIHNGVHVDSADKIISEDFFSIYSIKNDLIKNFLKPRYSGCCTAFDKMLKDIILPIPQNVGAYDHWIGMVGECFSNIYFDDRVLLYHRLHGDNVTVTRRRKIGTILNARVNLFIQLIKRKKMLKSLRHNKKL